MRFKTGFFFLITILLSYCGSPQKKEQRVINDLETRVEQAPPDQEEAKELIAKYKAYAEQFSSEDDLNSKYLYRAAGLAYRMNRFSEAIELLNQAIRNHYAGINTVNNALFLGAIYQEKLRNESLSATVYQATDKAFPNTDQIVEKLNPDWSDLDTRMTELQQQVFDPAGKRIDFRIANDFINSATIYGMLLPEQEASAAWLFEAAETARSIRAFSKSLELYQWIYQYFPESKKAPQSLFLHAFTLDSDLSRYDEARVLYQAFLEQHPDDEFVDDARFLLENIGKDENEIIRSFEEKNQVEQQ